MSDDKTLTREKVQELVWQLHDAIPVAMNKTFTLVADEILAAFAAQRARIKDVEPVLKAAWKLGTLITTNNEVGTRVSHGWEVFFTALASSTEAQRVKQIQEAALRKKICKTYGHKEGLQHKQRAQLAESWRCPRCKEWINLDRTVFT